MNLDTHYINKEAWMELLAMDEFRLYRHFWGKHRDMFGPVNCLNPDLTKASYWASKWDERTCGAGSLFHTLLYMLRAHSRGKTHCSDMTLDQQGAMLGFLAPLFQDVLQEKEISTSSSVAEQQF